MLLYYYTQLVHVSAYILDISREYSQKMASI